MRHLAAWGFAHRVFMCIWEKDFCTARWELFCLFLCREVCRLLVGYGVDRRGYIRLMMYAGVLMIALGIVLYSAEKHMIQKITACL